jgi:hypothetical protein
LGNFPQSTAASTSNQREGGGKEREEEESGTGPPPKAPRRCPRRGYLDADILPEAAVPLSVKKKTEGEEERENKSVLHKPRSSPVVKPGAVRERKESDQPLLPLLQPVCHCPLFCIHFPRAPQHHLATASLDPR